MSDRIEILKNSVNNAIRAICPERAILWTEYYKNKLNRNKPVEILSTETSWLKSWCQYKSVVKKRACRRLGPLSLDGRLRGS